MRITSRTTETREMFEGGRHSTVVQPVDGRRHQRPDQPWIAAERTVTDHRIGRIRAQVRNWRQVELDTQPVEARCHRRHRLSNPLRTADAQLQLRG